MTNILPCHGGDNKQQYRECVVTSLVVFGLMGPEFENVKESWFLIMLFTDIPKVTRMAQFALTSSHQRRIPANIAVRIYNFSISIVHCALID